MRVRHLLTAAAVGCLALASAGATFANTQPGPLGHPHVPGSASTPVAAQSATPLSTSYKLGGTKPAPNTPYLAVCNAWAAKYGGPGAACRWEKLGPDLNAGPCSLLRVWAPRYEDWVGGIMGISKPCYAPLKK